MILTKEDIEKRIKELDSAIIQQGQYVQQMNNQILMFHGAKEEYNVMLKQIFESEKMEQERLEAERLAAEKQAGSVTPDHACGESNGEQQEELQPAANG